MTRLPGGAEPRRPASGRSGSDPRGKRGSHKAVRAPDDRPVAVVTGASRGLGRLIALRLGSDGYRVAVHYHRAASASARVCLAVQRAGGQALALPADLCNPDQTTALISRVLAAWRRIDLLVHNAGVVHDGLLLRMPAAVWHEVVDTHLTAGFHLMQSAARRMAGRRQGQIITIGSIAGLLGRAGQANYAAAKAGLIALSKAAAREWAPYNIRVNCVLPGCLAVGMGRRLTSAQRARLRDDMLIGYGSAREVADWIVGLAATRRVTGQVFNLDNRLV